VRPNFSIRSLAEFTHLKADGGGGPLRSPAKKAAAGGGQQLAATRVYFTEFWEAGTPFDDALMDSSYEEDILMEKSHTEEEEEEEEDDLSEEQKQEILNENEEPQSALATLKWKAWSPPPPRHGLCLANTTLTLLRLFGRYTHLARLLHPIAEEIVRGMTQVFQYYVYAVHAFFVEELGAGEESEVLRQGVRSIYAALIKHAVDAPQEEVAGLGAAGGAEQQQQRSVVGLVGVPQISPNLNLGRKVETVFLVFLKGYPVPSFKLCCVSRLKLVKLVFDYNTYSLLWKGWKTLKVFLHSFSALFFPYKLCHIFIFILIFGTNPEPDPVLIPE
jgi:hypothetical protein